MKKHAIPIIRTLVLAVTALALSACPSALKSGLPVDRLISIGLPGAAESAMSLRAAENAAFSVSLLISDAFGKALAETHTVSLTLSTDQDLGSAGDNVELAQQSIAAGSEIMVSLSLPASVTAGNYFLFASFECPAGDPGQSLGGRVLNLSSRPITIAIAANALPDLVLELNAPKAPFLDPGSMIKFGFRVRNEGYASIASGTIIPLSATVPLLGGVDTEIGTVSLSLSADLLPQMGVNGELSVTLPSKELMASAEGEAVDTLEIWSEFLSVEVDPADAIDEISEANNDAGFSIESGNRKADIRVDSISFPYLNSSDEPIGKIGGPAELTVTVANYGYSSIDDYAVRVYIDIDENDTYDSGTDFIIHEWAAAQTPLVPYDPSDDGNKAQLSTFGLNKTYPSIPEGEYHLVAEITSSSGEYESVDGPNDRAANINLFPSLVDLQTIGLSTTMGAPIPSVTGGSLPVILTIRNAGIDTCATDFDVHFYASDNADLTPATDIDLSTLSITSDIGAGKSLSVPINLDFPASPVGFYTVYADLDSNGGGVVAENDETNNKPANANQAMLFVPVGDGATSIPTRLIAYAPRGGDSRWRYINLYVTRDDTGAEVFDEGGYVYTPSSAYIISNQTQANPATAYRLRVSGYEYSRCEYAFRIVPSYVSSLASSSLPMEAGRQEDSEPNNEVGRAHRLLASRSPWVSWVIGMIDGGVDTYDHYWTIF